MDCLDYQQYFDEQIPELYAMFYQHAHKDEHACHQHGDGRYLKVSHFTCQTFYVICGISQI